MYEVDEYYVEPPRSERGLRVGFRICVLCVLLVVGLLCVLV